jgi:dihydroorotate dehydrogenase (NAD+) catalytic subunit
MVKSVEPDLSVEIGALKLSNPVMTASGTCGYGLEFLDFYDLGELGGVVVKGLSPEPRAGNPPARVVETPAGMLNAIGLQNVGVEAFLRDKLPRLRNYDTRVIANVFGENEAAYTDVCARLDGAEGMAGVELNVSCPNTEAGGMAFGTDPVVLARITRNCRKATSLPLIVKLTPNVTDIRETARAAEEAGADAVSLVNTFVGMAVDVERRRPYLANVCGGLSGPAIRPLAVWLTWQVYNTVNIPVIGMGGIMDHRDALEFILAGATAVQVGTANFITPRAAVDVVEGLRDWLKANRIGSVRELVGTLQAGGS